ncbi:MAG: flagellar filament outer layer protein FlaA [Treponema sp.]|jgi:hypothetical protein|nr:flagellar filament outer layer protein FlaA [Treponema sp.]
MKRLFIFVAFALAAVGTLFADENVLIDFSNLVPDILLDQEGVEPQNRKTTMDYSITAGSNFTPEQRVLMRTSLAIPNWRVELSPSSKSISNSSNSYAKVVTSKQFENVMGVRVSFPVASYNSWALIRPPFDIPAYEFSDVGEDGVITPVQPESYSASETRFEGGYGVLKNVGAIKSIAVRVYGINALHSISAILINGNGIAKTVFMGYLDFNGWAELTWDNPQYINELRVRSLRIYQLYPSFAQYIRFGGFIIQRDGSNEGGDFVVYFKDVKLVYDKAQLDAAENDIDDDAEWGLIKMREADRQRNELANFGKEQIWRFSEGERKAPELYFSDLERAAAANAAANDAQ